MFIRLRQLLRRGHGQEGAAAVEFALILPLLIALLLGGMDLGHAYYIQHLITIASREGARYGVKYQLNPSTGASFAPNALTPSIENYVKEPKPTGLGFLGLLGSDANLTVTPGGAGYSSNTIGAILTVTVTADKHWWLLGSKQLIGTKLFGMIQLPGFSNPKTLTATAAMTLER